MIINITDFENNNSQNFVGVSEEQISHLKIY